MKIGTRPMARISPAARLRPTAWVLLGLVLVGCGGGPSPTAATPEGAVTLVLRELAAGRPVVLWNALPQTRQADIRGMLNEAAADVDPQLWEAGFTLIDKAAQVARKQQAFCLASKPISQAALRPSPADAEKAWGHLLEALSALSASELKTAAGLKQLDPPAFLSGAGATLLRQAEQAAPILGDANPFRKMQLARVTRLAEDEDDLMADVRIEYPGQAPITVPLARVQNHWLPADLGDNQWDATRAAWKARLTQFVAWQKDDKDRLLALVKQMDAQFDKLLAAQTQAEFDEALADFPRLRK